MKLVSAVLNIAILCGLLVPCDCVAQLSPLSTIYLPYEYQSDGNPMYGIDEGAVEQGVLDTTDMLYYGVGSNYLHVVDYEKDVYNPVIVHKMKLSTTANDIEVCTPAQGVPSLIGMAMEGFLPGDVGEVVIYDSYTGSNLFQRYKIPVGYKPDMLRFTSDCSTILVANEGEAWEDTAKNDLVNPEGSVSIIRLIDENAYSTINLDFQKYNGEGKDYVSKGVRWPYRGEISSVPSTFSQNLEPEYITFSYDETTAYVALQENNAIAEIDLTTNTIVDLYSVGTKSWNSLLLDPSDNDSGISMQNWDIFSLRQPDGIEYIEVDGIGYLITANEGDRKEYQAGSKSWKEFESGKYFFENNLLSDLVTPEMSNNLENEANLGRLQFSKNEGNNLLNPSLYDNFYMFGSRGFSVFNVSDYSLVFDSGDEVELMMEQYYPEVFNGNTKPDNSSIETPASLMDSRSDIQGPECESLEIGELNDRKLLFVGVDRSASILIYSFPSGSAVPVFESIYRAGGTGDTFDNLLAQRNLGDLDPEDLRFIYPKDNPPFYKSLLLVTSSVSGTVSLYEVIDV